MKRAAFAAASAGCFALAVWALDRPADASFAWHMTQHLVLFFAVPLLLLLAKPFEWFAALSGKATTAAVVRATRPLHAITTPPVAFFASVAVLWGTHFSALYEGALERPLLHAGEHALYVVAGTLFWIPLLHVPPLRPNSYPVRLLYLMIWLPQGALLAIALFAARAPLYAHYAAGMTPGAALADQHNAAAIMWIAGGLCVFVALLATLGAWAAREEGTLGYNDCTNAARSRT